jgi:hemerythrin-like domain-containing protein
MNPELEKQLPRPVKEVITDFPALVDVLNEYEIGCGTCLVGTCLLKDIVSVHGLPPEREAELMERIAAVLAPGGAPAPAAPPRRLPEPPTEHVYSPAIQRLVLEHVLIKKLLVFIPDIIARLDLSSPAGRQRVADGLDFIRSYADRFHHGKEEDILFKYFDAQSEIIQVMHSDHEAGRRYVRAAAAALAEREGMAVADHLMAYRELLQEHIQKEDQILFPWMDRNLSPADKEELVRQFDRAEKDMGTDLPEKYGQLIAAWEAERTIS